MESKIIFETLIPLLTSGRLSLKANKIYRYRYRYRHGYIDRYRYTYTYRYRYRCRYR